VGGGQEWARTRDKSGRGREWAEELKKRMSTEY